MFGKMRLSRRLVRMAIPAALACAGLMVAADFVATAQAQGLDQRYPFLSHRPRSGGFFQELFGPSHPRGHEYEPNQQMPRVDHTRAPPPHKVTRSVAPTTNIVVLGDDMADWLAYGLEDAFADAPEVAIVRKDKLHSGLLRYDAKSDLDWWHVARDVLTQEKANYVVMMLGLHDRENIRESDLAKEAEKQQAEKQQADKAQADKAQDAKGDDKNADKNAPKKDQPAIAAPEPAKPKPAPTGVIEFRTDRWATVYSKRIDETIAALKSKGVPVFWVGLPSIRGTKSTADAVYLNDLYRARAERAGLVYIDVWDGFVDDAGKFSSFGPDYEGQMRRLRSGDGVFFTNYGARKLAHYVEREIRRYMSNRSLQVALPTGPVAVPNAGKSTVRPVAGPVLPLTVTTGTTDQLLGGAGNRPAHGDSVATRALVNGEPVAARPGRADDFAWPPGSDANRPPPAADQRSSAAPAVARTEPPAASVQKPAGSKGDFRRDIKSESAQQPAPNAAAKPTLAPEKPKPAHASAPRRRSGSTLSNPFGWLR